MSNNSTLFHIKTETIETANKIKSFYQENYIELTFKSVVSYLNFKSYLFVTASNIALSNVEKIELELRSYLNIDTPIRIIFNENNEISFEIYNKHRKEYHFLDAIESEKFQKPKDMVLPILLGDRNGTYVTDLTKLRHLLIVGETGAGKSNFINALILSLLYHHSPETLRLLLIDPKVVELSVYSDIPHLLTPVITDIQGKAKNALSWCLNEMERRYYLLCQAHVRNITQYNEKIAQKDRLPYIVIVIDEFADCMAAFGTRFEEYVMRITLFARAVGIHMVMATQRSSADIVADLIEENMLSRITFIVSSILEPKKTFDGAKYLCGRGDILFSNVNSSDLLRIQVPFVGDDVSSDISQKLCSLGKPEYISIPEISEPDKIIEYDPLTPEVFAFIVETGLTSRSSIQRRFCIDFYRAGRIIDYLEDKGIISSPSKLGKRELLKTDLVD